MCLCFVCLDILLLRVFCSLGGWGLGKDLEVSCGNSRPRTGFENGESMHALGKIKCEASLLSFHIRISMGLQA